jgi:hypothetical protein
VRAFPNAKKLFNGKHNGLVCDREGKLTLDEACLLAREISF